jgi:iron complex outermembrane recepter protein
MRSNRELASRRVKLLTLLIAGSLASGHANAQQAPKSEEKKDEVKLDTIVVTATKRLEPLQSIPVAVSVVSGDDLEKANLNNITSITQQIPAVNYRANASNKDTALFIRGVGTISTSPGVEPTVATVVDGVVLARPGMATLDLMEVERMEVLRGPQGTLFGKNASAGVINIVSKAIPKQTEGYVDFGYYDKKETRLRVGIAGPLVAGAASGSVAVFTGKYDGNVNNVFLNRLVNGYDRSGVRGKLEFTPNKNVTLTFIADYAKADDTGTRGPFVRTTTAPLTDAVLPQRAGTENRDISTDVLERVNDKNYGVSGQVDFTTARGTLTSITAFRQWENTQYQDIDGLPRAISQQANLSDVGVLESKQSSQELRWASAKGGFIDYVAGFLYFKNTTDEVYRRDVQRCGSTLPALPSGLIPCGTLLNDFGVAGYGTELKSTSFFGESVWNFDKGLRGIFGLRHTKDDLSYYHGRVSTQAGAIPGVQPTRAPVSGSTSQSAVSGRIGPQMDLSKEVSVYATYSRGYKGPAYNAFFNMQPSADIALNPETSKGWELGLKSTLADNRVRLNVAVFDTKYKGYQANFPDLVGGVVVTRFINAGDVSTKGIELDVQGKVTKEITLSAAYANTKAVVDQFNCPPGATCTIPSGTMLPSAPRRKGVVRANYRTDFGNYLVDFGTDYTWQSETQFDLSTSPNTLQPGYGVWNAAMSITNLLAGLRVTLVGKNLADKSYSQFLLPGANTQRSVPRDERRYFGINIRYDF